ncbi:MAG: hypothetical protein M1828_004020 [Chrysothrix sp. TS-e1954]|nr:MAG: hypothetical protein M1828_004020 [Chrysothrix sp. TS-e1954]
MPINANYAGIETAECSVEFPTDGPELRMCRNLSVEAFADDIVVAHVLQAMRHDHTLVNIFNNAYRDNPKLNVPSPALARQACLAFANIFFGSAMKSERTKNRGVSLYVETLRLTNTALDDTLVTDQDTWISHTQGLQRLFLVFGPPDRLAAAERWLLERWRPFMIIGSISAGEASLLSQPGWEADPSYCGQGRLMCKLLDTFAHLSVHYRDWHKLVAAKEHSSPHVITDLTAVSERVQVELVALLRLYFDLSSRSQEVCTESTSALGKKTRTFNWFWDFSVPSAAESLPFCSAIVLLMIDLTRQIESVMLTLSDVSGPCTGTTTSNRHFNHTDLQSIVENAIRDICRSVEYHITHADGSVNRFYITFPMRVARQLASPLEQQYLYSAFLRLQSTHERGIWRAPLRRRWKSEPEAQRAFDAIFG